MSTAIVTGHDERHGLRERLQEAVGTAYAVDRELGRGGMAVVYLAEDRRHRRSVAIKVLHPDLAGSIGAARFLREIEAAARLSHPNILPLHDSGARDGLLYYVMPYAGGESLRHRLTRERQLPVDDALRIAREVAEALDHAHARALVHRDIKPENILLQDGRAVVSDFGIALAVGAPAGDTLTATGMAVGTPAYMSPEQAAGERAVDGRSDEYSLGCVVYEMLAGAPPYTGGTPQAVLARKMMEPVPKLRVVRETVPEAADAALARALAKAPADRFATATQFVAALERAFTAAQPRAARAAAAAVAVALTGVALTGAALLAGRGGWPPRAAQDPSSPLRPAAAVGDTSRIASLAVLPLENLSGDPEQEYFVAGMHTALIGELARVGALRVISRTSVMRYRNSGKSIPEIARELRVDGVVEGAVLRAGDSVRLQVQLVRVGPTERELWSHAYARPVREVLALQGDVAREVARTAGVAVDRGEAARPARPVDPRAHEAYLRAMFHLGRSTPDGFASGMRYLHEALAIDPAEPLAWARLAAGYSQIGHDRDPQAFARAKAAARRALELDPDLAEAHSVLGELAVYDEYDAATAVRHLRRALELKPSMAATRYHLGWALSLIDRPAEALAEQQRAEELDPLSAKWPASVGWFHAWYGGTPDEIVAAARRALELDPAHPFALYALGAGHIAGGAYADAVVAQEQLRASPFWYGLARAYALAGRPAEARRLAIRAERAPGALDKWGLAEVYCALGDRQRAIRWLEAAHAARFSWMPWVRVNPALAPLRGDPRFEALARRVRAPGPPPRPGTGAPAEQSAECSHCVVPAGGDRPAERGRLIAADRAAQVLAAVGSRLPAGHPEGGRQAPPQGVPNREGGPGTSLRGGHAHRVAGRSPGDTRAPGRATTLAPTRTSARSTTAASQAA